MFSSLDHLILIQSYKPSRFISHPLIPIQLVYLLSKISLSATNLDSIAIFCFDYSVTDTLALLNSTKATRLSHHLLER